MTSHRSLHATPKRIAAAIASALASGFLHATPSTPVVTNGQAQVEQHPGNMIIHQTSQRAVLEYQQFSIGAGESVQFIQPNAQSLTLNKVTGPDASQIAGQLSANGHVYLVNPNGVFFSPGAQVDVTGLVVTTLDIDRDDFMSGDFTLHSPGNGEIVNQADINADALLAFVAPFIRNEGTLAADKQVQLLAEDTLVITPNGEHTGIAVSRDAIAESDRTVINQGDIKGHWVVLSAGAVDALHQSLVDNAGAVRAHSLADLTGGAIEAAASSVNNTGTLLADAQGEIVITGDYLYNNGHMATPGGTISLNAEKVLVLDHQSEQDASATTTGDGGSVINYAKGFAHFNADARIAARGGSESGNGGFVEVSGIDYVEAYGLVDTRAANGTTGTYLIDPTDITISAAAESGGAFGGPPYNWVPSGASSNIDVGILQTNLQTSSVTINTASGFAGTGDITIATDIDIDGSGANVLNLIADNNIIMNAGTTISDSNTGTVESMQLNMQAGGNLIMATTASLSLGGGKFGGVFGGNADISAIVSLNNAADAITLAVGDTLTDIHGATNNFITPGGVIITAGTVNPLLVSVNSMDLTTTVGNATITSSGAISFSDIDTAGNATINMSAGALTIAGFTDAANLTLNAGAGNVILPDAGIAITGNVNITAGDLLDADRSVILSGNNLVLNTGIAAGDLTINGNFNTVDLTQTGTNTLTYDDADTVAINNFSVTGGGGLDILSFGDMNIATDIDYDGNNGAALTIGSYANNLLLNANILDSNTGTNDAIGLVLTAGNNLVMLDTSQVDINNGVLLVNATGDVTLGNLASTNNTGVAITVTAGNRILDGGDTFTDIVAVNGNTHLTAVNGISDIEIQTERLSLTNTGSGNTTVTETNTVIMDTINTVGTATINATARIEIADGVVVSAQNLTLNSTDLQLGNAGIANVSGTLNIAADNIYDADQTVNLAAGTLVLNTNLAGGDLVVNSTINNADISLSSANSFTLNNTGALSLDNLIMGTGTYQINSTGNLTLANTIDTNSSIGATLGLNSSGGDLLINANIEDTIASGDNVTINLDAGNDIIMLDGTVVSANDADITLNAGNNVVVSSLHSTNTAGLAITVTAGNQIIDGGDLDQDIRPLGGRASLTAVNGIGMGNAIETRGTALDLFNTGSGDIEAYNFSGTMDVRTLNNVGNTYLSSADAIKIQSGAVVATQDLSLIATTNIELPDTAIANIAGTFTLSGTDIFDSDRTVAFAAIPVDITTATAGGDSVFGLTGSSITLNNTGTSLITLNKTNAGNLAIVNGDTGSGDLSVNLLDGLLQVNNTATGLRTAGALSISANSIFDVPNDGVVTLRGSSVNLNLLQTSTALQTNLFTNQLTLTGPSATNLTVQRNSGDLNINAINWAGDLTFNLNSGRLILNNSGLTSAGTLTLSADDLLDSDRTLILTANNLNLASGFTGGDLTLNTTVANLGITNSGINALTVNETDALTLTSLNSTGALSISNAGNLTLGPVAAVTDLDLTSTGDVITDDTGLNNVSGTLAINAADLRDSDRSVTLGAGTLTLASGFTGGDLTLNTTVANLGITNSGTNALTVNETDALTLTSLNSTGTLSISNTGNLMLAPVTAVTDLNLTSTGDVITDDSGLNNVNGTLVVNAADLRDSDRSVTLGAGTLTLASGFTGGDLTLNTTVANLGITNSGTNALTVNETDALTLTSLNSTGTLSLSNTGNLTLAPVTAVTDLNLTSTGDVITDDSGLNNVSGTLSINAADLRDSDRSVTLGAGTLTLASGFTGGDLTLNTTVANLGITNSGTNALTVNETDALTLTSLNSTGTLSLSNTGNLTLAPVTAVTDLNLTSTGDVITDDSGLNNVSGTLSINAADLRDSDRSVTLGAGTLTLASGFTGGDLTLNTTVANLGITNSGTNALTVNETDALTLTTLNSTGALSISNAGNLTLAPVTAVTDLNLTSTGDVITDDSGLNNVSGTLAINAADLRDSDRSVTLGAGTLTLASGFTGGDLTLNTTVANLGITNSGTNALTVNETDALTLTTLNSTGALSISNAGNLTLAPVTSVTDLNLTSTGDVITDDSGLNNVSGTLAINAADLRDSDRSVSLGAGTLTLASGFTGGDLTLNTTVANLGITNSGTNVLTVNETDALTLTSLNSTGALSISNTGNLTLAPVTAVTDLNLTSTGDVITDDSGLNNVSGTLVINAADLRDSDRSVTLGAGTLTLASGFTGGDLTLNTTVANLGITNSGTNALTVNETDALTLTSLNSTGALTISNTGNLTLAPVTAVTDLNLTSTGDVITDDSGLNNVSGTLVINAADLRDSDRSVSLGAGTLTLASGFIGGDLTLNTTAANLGITNSGTNALTVNETDALTLTSLNSTGALSISNAGNLTLAPVTAVTDLNLTSTGDVITDDTGLNNVSGTLVINAADLRDSDRNVTLQANTASISLAAQAGATAIDSQVTNLNWTGSNALTLTQTGALQLNADMGGADLSIASNDNILITGLILPANVAITTSGTLQLPDALPTAGSWQLTAADLFDSDRQLTLNGANLFLDLSAPGGNLAIASNAAQADLNFANHQLTLDTTPAGALALNDLDSDGFAAQISNGSLRINLLQNDLFINSDMQATDTVADGTRHGKLGIFLSGGNLTLANGVTLAALNNVENSIGGGWDNDQTALLIRQLDQTDTSYTWTIGTNALLEAQGGDLVLDNYNDAALNTGVRTITLNTGSSLRSYNSLGDSQTGTVINQSVDASNATLSAYANRQLALLTEAPTPTPTPVPTPVPTPMPTPTPERPVDLDSVQNDLSKPTENTETSTPNETANPSVDNLLTRATGACQPDNSSQDTSPRCKNQAAIERFLGSLLIGGQLPQVGDSSK